MDTLALIEDEDRVAQTAGFSGTLSTAGLGQGGLGGDEVMLGDIRQSHKPCETQQEM